MSTKLHNNPDHATFAKCVNANHGNSNSFKRDCAECCESNFTEKLALGLIKEFLSAKGLKRTLTAFNEDCKVGELTPVTSRSELVKSLGIAKLIKSNKAKTIPLESYLEVIASALAEKSTLRPKSQDSAQKKEQMGSLERLTQRQHPQHNVSPLGDFSSSNVQASTQKVTEAKYADLINRTAFSMSNATISLNTFSPTQEKLKSPNSKILNDLEISENFTDDEDFQVETNIEIIQPVSNSNAARVQKIKLSSSDVTKINRLLCPDGLTNRGNQIGSFGEEWKNKGFVFSSVEDLKYGLVQINGGPCGLLAAVQCYVLKNLLFKSKTSATKDNKLQFSLKQTQGALIEGLSEIIWKCSSRHRRALVVIIPKSDVSWDIYSTRMEVSQIDNLTELKQFISSNILSFTNNSGGYHGLIQLLISVILSRGLDVIQNEDMDEPECKLIGKHGYCTQELVNLIVLGKAISNVFDGDVRLGDNSNFKLLKGVKSQPEFGFLSLFEHYKSLKVGEYYKNPEYPIFIVCSESHFTVLFSATTPIPELSPTRNMELIYYDGLANQDSEIKLTLSVLPRIKNGRFLSNSREVEDSDVPPLELCIGTKWTNAVVDWNGTDPIL